MSDATNFRIAEDLESLSEIQKSQFKGVIMEGLQGKFTQTLPDDTESILKIIDIWVKYDFLPMDETFCVIDETNGDVLAILLLNNYKKPNTRQSIDCLRSVIKAIGFKKAMKIAFNFLELDNLNKEENTDRIAGEIYLVSTRTDLRGKGIGTLIMNAAIKAIRSKIQNKPGDVIKLLVFEKNPALHLYEHLGFTRINSVPTPKMAKAFGGDYDVLIRMEKPL
ncbi:MAG TPA: GNAT family N-acetyltransferase [Oscillospiraceae bacterium]|nr:GNAT family N-acetyltransferase [Oscillospiraceae bacterium]HPF55553.1 GNAT family N-acetyltransferase [Clostridiales bacterium]HPK34661.1 GNAT family N-acetyltransferase [Oscillospiraceae bacterium]HPR74575.1 GNAT family N-acetyltransferase [Oscillospiraceae bacterium]